MRFITVIKRVADPYIFLSDPDPRSRNPDLRIRQETDPTRKLMYPMEKVCCQIGKV
jgi:hypothetical protein